MLDLETTGLSPAKGDRVIEIAALAIEGGEVSGTFQSFVNPRKKIPWQASRVHGITDAMLAGQPLPRDVYPAFHEFISDSLLVAHNAIFDLSFLQHEFRFLGMTLENPFLCTLQMARKRYPCLPNHRLETVALHVLGALPVKQRHRALGDAVLTARVLLAMKGMRAKAMP